MSTHDTTSLHTDSNVHSAADRMIRNKMSWEWRISDEAKEKSNTYSCKTGSQDGCLQITVLTRPVHTHTRSQWKAIDPQGTRGTRWDEQRYENTKNNNNKSRSVLTLQNVVVIPRLSKSGKIIQCDDKWQSDIRAQPMVLSGRCRKYSNM